MHLTRQEVNMKIPIKRKGNKYVARASSDPNNSVSVVLAIRDMLNLARTSAEVKQMIHNKLIKINNRLVSEHNESIKLFSILHADKEYMLTLSPTKRYVFEETKETKHRICKVMNKTLVGKNLIQLNMHDGSNLLVKNNDIAVGDSVTLDMSGKLVSHKPIKKGAKILVIQGKMLGSQGTIKEVSGKNVEIEFKDSNSKLNRNNVVVL